MELANTIPLNHVLCSAKHSLGLAFSIKKMRHIVLIGRKTKSKIPSLYCVSDKHYV